jgi:hypothetical protein
MISNEQLVTILMEDALNRAVKEYGLEGSLEAIERIYPKDSKIKKEFLKILKKRLKK